MENITVLVLGKCPHKIHHMRGVVRLVEGHPTWRRINITSGAIFKEQVK
jgi:hypothetical protein